MLARLAKAGLIQPVGEPTPLRDDFDTTPVELRTRWRLTEQGKQASTYGFYEDGK